MWHYRGNSTIEYNTFHRRSIKLELAIIVIMLDGKRNDTAILICRCCNMKLSVFPVLNHMALDSSLFILIRYPTVLFPYLVQPIFFGGFIVSPSFEERRELRVGYDLIHDNYCNRNGNDIISFALKNISKSYKNKDHER